MSDPYTSWLTEVMKAGNRLADALHRYEESRHSRSVEAQRHWLDLLAARDEYEGLVAAGSERNLARPR